MMLPLFHYIPLSVLFLFKSKTLQLDKKQQKTVWISEQGSNFRYLVSAKSNILKNTSFSTDLSFSSLENKLRVEHYCRFTDTGQERSSKIL